MVEDQATLDDAFHALSHPVRRDMLARLGDGALTVGELAAPALMSLAAASPHVQVLERAGMVRRTIDGRRHVCRLEPAPLASASEWLRLHERFWRERLDDIQAMLESPTSGSP